VDDRTNCSYARQNVELLVLASHRLATVATSTNAQVLLIIKYLIVVLRDQFANDFLVGRAQLVQRDFGDRTVASFE
jgi:hypothetical protein